MNIKFTGIFTIILLLLLFYQAFAEDSADNFSELATNPDSLSTEEIRHDILTIATSAQGYFLQSPKFGGGGSSFKGLDFRKIKFDADSVNSANTIAYHENVKYRISIIKAEEFTLLVSTLDGSKQYFRAIVERTNVNIYSRKNR